MSKTQSKSYKDIGDVPPQYDDELLLDHVVELLGQFKKKSAIFENLRGDFPEISSVTVSVLISRATAKIRETLNTNPNDYKGRIIECLEQIISGKSSHKDRLKALEMLANYTGVNIAASEDPASYAQRVVEAMKAADESVCGVLPGQEDNNGEPDKQTQETSQTEQVLTQETSQIIEETI